jgi:hypothetical protein
VTQGTIIRIFPALNSTLQGMDEGWEILKRVVDTIVAGYS